MVGRIVLNPPRVLGPFPNKRTLGRTHCGRRVEDNPPYHPSDVLTKWQWGASVPAKPQGRASPQESTRLRLAGTDAPYLYRVGVSRCTRLDRVGPVGP